MHLLYYISMREISILEQQLLDEYFRCIRNKDVQTAAIANLPKGYISSKRRGDKVYYYLQWRDGNKVCSRYLKPSEVENTKKQINERRSWSASVKQLERNMKQIKKVLGKGLIDEYRDSIQK